MVANRLHRNMLELLLMTPQPAQESILGGSRLRPRERGSTANLPPPGSLALYPRTSQATTFCGSLPKHSQLQKRICLLDRQHMIPESLVLWLEHRQSQLYQAGWPQAEGWQYPSLSLQMPAQGCAVSKLVSPAAHVVVAAEAGVLLLRTRKAGPGCLASPTRTPAKGITATRHGKQLSTFQTRP